MRTDAEIVESLQLLKALFGGGDGGGCGRLPGLGGGDFFFGRVITNHSTPIYIMSGMFFFSFYFTILIPWQPWEIFSVIYVGG